MKSNQTTSDKEGLLTNRNQQGIFLPSGAHKNDLCTKGEQYGYWIKNRLIEIDEETFKELLNK